MSDLLQAQGVVAPFDALNIRLPPSPSETLDWKTKYDQLLLRAKEQAERLIRAKALQKGSVWVRESDAAV